MAKSLNSAGDSDDGYSASTSHEFPQELSGRRRNQLSLKFRNSSTRHRPDVLKHIICERESVTP